MKERTILADCCEDWILGYGRHYSLGEEFCCPECATSWKKLSPGRFRREPDQRTFVEQARSSEDARFPYLSPEDGSEPLVERCCAQILLRFGERLAVAELNCPVCHTHWRKERLVRGGLELVGFCKEGLDEAFVIQLAAGRDYLVPVSSYRAPND